MKIAIMFTGLCLLSMGLLAQTSKTTAVPVVKKTTMAKPVNSTAPTRTGAAATVSKSEDKPDVKPDGGPTGPKKMTTMASKAGKSEDKPDPKPDPKPDDPKPGPKGNAAMRKTMTQNNASKAAQAAPAAGAAQAARHN